MKTTFVLGWISVVLGLITLVCAWIAAIIGRPLWVFSEQHFFNDAMVFMLLGIFLLASSIVSMMVSMHSERKE